MKYVSLFTPSFPAMVQQIASFQCLPLFYIVADIDPTKGAVEVVVDRL